MQSTASKGIRSRARRRGDENHSDPHAGVIIYPLGPVAPDILRHLALSIEQQCQLRCSIRGCLENPAYAYDPLREQYSSTRVLRELERCSPSPFWRVLGVTEKDLFVPILKYVFGAAQMKGRCAVISLYRLRPQYYGQKNDRGLLLERLVKTALHELGHTLGLTHCRRRTCVMYSSTRTQDTDLKSAAFCPTCKELFRWRLEGNLR